VVSQSNPTRRSQGRPEIVDVITQIDAKNEATRVTAGLVGQKNPGTTDPFVKSMRYGKNVASHRHSLAMCSSPGRSGKETAVRPWANRVWGVVSPT